MTTNNRKPLAHRNQTTPTYTDNAPYYVENVLARVTYGVPTNRRMLSPGLLVSKHHLITTYLSTLGLTPAEREAVLYLLRLYAYYGRVYPKASDFSTLGGCSKRSFWRAISKLDTTRFIDRINRYLHHLQISNSYRLDKLVLCIIRYLAEHGARYPSAFAQQCFEKIGNDFWRRLDFTRVRLRDPIPLTFPA